MKNRIILLLSLLAFQAYSQEFSNPRDINKNGITITAGGPGIYGSVSYGNFINPYINVEFGAGPATLFGGVKYHIKGKTIKSWTTYMGGYGVYIWLFDIFNDDDEYSSMGAYFPLGINYISNGGFSFSLEGAAFVGAGEILPFGALKLGYHF